MVMLRVSVKLLDRKEKIHVGKVMVMKLTTQYSRLGMIVNTPSSRPPSMPVVDWTPAGLGAVVEVVWLASEVSDSVNMEGSVPSTREASIFTRVELSRARQLIVRSLSSNNTSNVQRLCKCMCLSTLG